MDYKNQNNIYSDLVTNDRIIYKYAHTVIIEKDKDEYKNKIIFNGVI